FFLISYTSTTDIFILSLHDALPICNSYTFNTIIKCLIVYSNSVGNNINYLIKNVSEEVFIDLIYRLLKEQHLQEEKDEILSYDTDRKSTRLNSSHVSISYAVFCLKK